MILMASSRTGTNFSILSSPTLPNSAHEWLVESGQVFHFETQLSEVKLECNQQARIRGLLFKVLPHTRYICASTEANQFQD
jgi:hypothetical protein